MSTCKCRVNAQGGESESNLGVTVPDKEGESFSREKMLAWSAEGGEEASHGEAGSFCPTASG